MNLDYGRIAEYWRRAASAAGANPDFAAGANDRVPASSHAFCRRGQLDYLLEAFSDLSPESDVLDLGAGPGVFSLALAERVRSVLGIDVAPAFVSAATREAERR